MRIALLAGVIPVILLAAGCEKKTGDGPMIIAHRGASQEAPENTLAAFRLAWKEQADGIEGDFYLTRDGHVVCIHDASTRRTAGQHLPVAESTKDALHALDVGSWKGPKWKGEPIPTLEDVLNTMPAGRQIFIEVKCGPEILPALKRVLDNSGLKSSQMTIICFDEAVIAEAKKTLPGIAASWLVEFTEDPDSPSQMIDKILSTAARIRADAISCEAHPGVNARWVARLRAAGLAFHVWTINDAATAYRFQALGADSITTDRPGWLRQALGDSGAG